MKLLLCLAIFCGLAIHQIRSSITKEELARDQVDNNLKFIGFGLTPTDLDSMYVHWDVSWGECLQACLDKRESDGKEWNGVEYLFSQNYCWCQKNDVGDHEDDPTKEVLHLRFQEN